MAYLKIFPIKVTDKKAIAYITNPDKTEGSLLVSSFGCSPETADLEFAFTREQGKNNVMDKEGNLAFHLIQSFKPGEVDAETAHKLGQEFADAALKGKYEYVISTHVDRGHIHNHILFNATSFQDYHKYVSNKRSYHKLCRISNRLCHEHGLSESMPTGEKGKSYKENQEYHRGTSWKAKLKAAVDKAVWSSISYEEFLQKMKLAGYEIRQGKNLAFRAPEQKNFTYMKSLGSYYTEDRIRQRLEKNRHKIKSPKTQNRQVRVFIDIAAYVQSGDQPGFEKWAKLNNLKEAAKTFNYLSENDLLSYDRFRQHGEDLSGALAAVSEKIANLEKQETDTLALQKKCRTYRTCRDIVQSEVTAPDPGLYRQQHQSEYELHKALLRELKEMGYSRIPTDQKLERGLDHIKQEKSSALREKQNLQKQQKQFAVIQENMEVLLERPSKEQSISTSISNSLESAL